MKKALAVISEDSSISQLSTDQVKVAKEYFDKFLSPWIERIIKLYHERDDLGGKICAVKELYISANYSWQKHQDILAELFPNQDEASINTKKIFTSFSRYNTGNIRDEDSFFIKMPRCLGQSDRDLKNSIGNFFKNQFLSYLKEHYYEQYSKAEESLNAQISREDAIAIEHNFNSLSIGAAGSDNRMEIDENPSASSMPLSSIPINSLRNFSHSERK